MRWFWLVIAFHRLFTAQATAVAPPTWTINPSDYQFSMQIIAKLEYNNSPVNEPAALIGAFQGANLQGFSSTVLINGNYYFFITVYSNKVSGDTLNFRAYYPPNDKLYGANVTTTFLATKTLGSVNAPFIINIDPDFDFKPFLLPFEPDTTLQYLDFNPLFLEEKLLSQDNDPVIWSATPGPNFIASIKDGYLSVRSSVPGWTGTDSILITATESTQNAYAYSRYVKLTVLEDYGPPILSPIPPQLILPGDAFLPVTLDSFLTFSGPAHRFSVKAIPFRGTENLPDWTVIPTGSPTMKMVVRPLFNGQQLDDSGSRIAVFVNNTLAGSASPSGASPYVTYTLTIQNVASGKLSFRFYDNENRFLYLKNTQLDFTAGKSIGSAAAPYLLQLSPLSIIASEVNVLSVTVNDTSWRGVIPVDLIVEDYHFPADRRDTTRTFFSVFSSSVPPVFNAQSEVDFQENTCLPIYDVESSGGIFSEGFGISYSISGGSDAALFAINPETGVLSWKMFHPDYELPVDSGADNTYEVMIRSINLNNQFTDFSLTINVTDNPVEVMEVQVTGVTSLCSGMATTLTAIGPGTYHWSNGLGSNASITVMPIATSVYTVTLTSQGECTTSSEVTVTVNPLPVVTAGLYGPFCSGASNISLDGFPLGGVWMGEGVSGTGPYAFDLASGTQTLTYHFSDYNGCSDSDHTTIRVDTLPAALEISGNTICSFPGEEGVIDSENSITGLSYQLFSGSNDPVGSPKEGAGSSLSWTDLPAGAGYYVVSTDDNGCTTTGNPAEVATVLCILFQGQLKWSKDPTIGVGKGSIALQKTSNNASLDADLTLEDGLYELNIFDYDGSSVRIRPEKNINLLNGVTAADALRISKHAANSGGVNGFTNPFDLIAGDVNRNNIVSSQDAVLVNGAILGNPLALLQFNTSWRFVPEAHTFPTNPPPGKPLFPVPVGFWSFPEQLTYQAVNADQIDQNFIGIKLGDVQVTSANPALRGVAPLVWKVEDRMLETGTKVLVAFKAYGFKDLAALQFALRFNTDYLQYMSVEILPRMPFGQEHFGAYNVDGGELRTSWFSESSQNITNGTTVFKIRFNVLQGGLKLSDVLYLDRAIVVPEAYNPFFEPLDIFLDFAAGSTMRDDVQGDSYDDCLFQNEPNPFLTTTRIAFELSAPSEAVLSIYDASGILLWENRAYREAGRHVITFRPDPGQASGLLYYTLRTQHAIFREKMVFNSPP